ncbi:killer suppression protein [Actinobacillus succinogenes]|uniref:Killer suppression protein HigA, putative n=1 Tax=Actinobacillus succinogenes (strain ATCC 55618 / DSM 22257 / CCUG 43843 / 130Z) TaxID=339671 RepID=A6VNM9_ACTSZ|nr:killer suppression protein [Actinobacillus succinogenes]ABR74576.1 killer suppression protein HigA, putative [Actinobacillus succinogenes 130Z]PHI41001.1 killer suppression protein [Actinobacillus succinogenes]
MEIIFATKKMQKIMNNECEMQKVYGQHRARKLQRVLYSLRAVSTLAELGAPYSPPHRCHELTGDKKRLLSLDLDHPYRLLFEPYHDPIPTKEDGGLDWSKITCIKVLSITDTH